MSCSISSACSAICSSPRSQCRLLLVLLVPYQSLVVGLQPLSVVLVQYALLVGVLAVCGLDSSLLDEFAAE